MFNIFTREGLILFLYTLPALLISLAVHEFSHAYVAYKLGDRSQKALGRLTLDPFSHIDWIGFLFIALFGFGWGKPVYTDDSNFKNKDKGNMLVALAGPLSNLLIALIFTIVLKLLLMFNVISMSNSSVIIFTMLLMTIQFNIIFFVFNMIPLPPFDGSKVLYYILPRKHKHIMYTLQRYSLVIILLLVVTHLDSVIISPLLYLVEKIINFILLL